MLHGFVRLTAFIPDAAIKTLAVNMASSNTESCAVCPVTLSSSCTIIERDLMLCVHGIYM